MSPVVHMVRMWLRGGATAAKGQRALVMPSMSSRLVWDGNVVQGPNESLHGPSRL